MPAPRAGRPARGATRGLGHPCGSRVDTDDDRSRLGAGSLEHGPAVAGADVHDHPVGPGDPMGDLSDVHLEGASADDLLHGPQSTLGS